MASPLAEVAAIDARSVETAGQRAGVVAAVAGEAVRAIVDALPGGWSGAGHDASVIAAADLRRRLNVLAGALETVALVLAALAVTLRSLQGELVAALRVVATAGPLDVQPAVNRQLGLAEDAFSQADRRAAALIRDVLPGLLPERWGQRPGVVLSPAGGIVLAQAQSLATEVAVMPAVPATPPAIAVWWAGLSSSSQARLTNSWPFPAGGMDGVPARVRDTVNRRQLAYAIVESEDAQAKEDQDSVRELTLTVARALPWPLSSILTAVTGDRAAARVKVLRDLQKTLQPPGSELLAFDAAGDGRAVVASGDVESSRSVAVIVPGMTTELADLPRLSSEGSRLAAAAGVGAAAISWLGYDAPGFRQVISDGKAKSGAVLLRRFTAGLRSTASLRQQLTVIGHSYGSLVTGIAARGELAADNLVLLASPGVEASRASQLHVPAGHVWAVRALTDPIQVVFWPARVGRLLGLPIPTVFGPDPAAAAFGARRFDISGAYGHSGYFASGSQSLDNLGRIISSRPVAQ